MFQAENTTDLVDRATQLVEQASRAGADRSDAVVVRGRSTSVSVRLGKVESTEASESDSFALRVFVGDRVASVSANAGTDAAELAAAVGAEPRLCWRLLHHLAASQRAAVVAGTHPAADRFRRAGGASVDHSAVVP